MKKVIFKATTRKMNVDEFKLDLDLKKKSLESVLGKRNEKDVQIRN